MPTRLPMQTSLIFGSLGHIHKHLVRGLLLGGLHKKDAKRLAKCSSVSPNMFCLSWSVRCNILTYHVGLVKARKLVERNLSIFQCVCLFVWAFVRVVRVCVASPPVLEVTSGGTQAFTHTHTRPDLDGATKNKCAHLIARTLCLYSVRADARLDKHGPVSVACIWLAPQNALSNSTDDLSKGCVRERDTPRAYTDSHAETHTCTQAVWSRPVSTPVAPAVAKHRAPRLRYL